MKIGVVSLGCDKNRVDTEKMLARLIAAGHTVTASEAEADVIIVNTCAFIDSAKEESIDEIFKALAAKKADKRKKVIVTGCLSQRYAADIEKQFKKVDAVLGVNDYDDIVETVSKVCGGDKIYGGAPACGFYADRALTTPYHYAYLKIADGCNNRCTYCAIPSIRGRYRSERQEDLLEEARKLSDNGVKELILVAQDVTRYGVDFDGKPHLTQLVSELAKLDFEWIRLMYLEPEMVDDDLIRFVVEQPKVVKYMDVPLQHVDSDVLRRMNRHTDEQYTHALVKKLKDAGITVRSTFICGFPGESEQAFEKLKQFVISSDIDYAGFFAYSREEGTPADKLDGHLPQSVRNDRAQELAELEAQLIERRHAGLVGQTVKVIYDDIDYDGQRFVGRMSTQAPDVDSVIYMTSDVPLQIGQFYDVQLTGTEGTDLLGVVKNANHNGN